MILKLLEREEAQANETQLLVLRRNVARPLPRPSEASLMAFRGLPRPCEASAKSQNPFSLQDYEASGTRAYIILLKGSPQGLGPERTLAASLLSSV